MDKINKEILEETLREHPEFKKFHDKRIEEQKLKTKIAEKQVSKKYAGRLVMATFIAEFVTYPLKRMATI